MPENNFVCPECHCCECEPIDSDGEQVRCVECRAVFDVVITITESFKIRKFGKFHDLECEEVTA